MTTDHARDEEYGEVKEDERFMDPHNEHRDVVRLANKALPMPEPPAEDARYNLALVSNALTECTQYLVQCKAKLDEAKRNMERAQNDLAKATAVGVEATHIAQLWVRKLNDLLEDAL